MRLLRWAALRLGALRHGQVELQCLFTALHRDAGVGLRLQCGHGRKQLRRVADLGAADREHHVARAQPAAAGGPVEPIFDGACLAALVEMGMSVVLFICPLSIASNTRYSVIIFVSDAG